MKINKKKMVSKFLIISMLIILVLPFVSAIGMGSSYSNEKPLEISPGEEKVVTVYLQNWDIEEEITLVGEILKGSEVASLKEKEIKIPYQVKVTTDMIVKIPETAQIGDTYNIEYVFKQSGEEGQGMVTFAQSITSSFNVNVVAETPSEELERISTTTIIILVIAIIAVIAIIWFLIKRKK